LLEIFQERLEPHASGIAIARPKYYLLPISVLTCKLPSVLDGRLAAMAKRRGVSKSHLVREAIEAKIAEEAGISRRDPANLIEALGDSIGSIASGKRDLARNKNILKATAVEVRHRRNKCQSIALICP